MFLRWDFFFGPRHVITSYNPLAHRITAAIRRFEGPPRYEKRIAKSGMGKFSGGGSNERLLCVYGGLGAAHQKNGPAPYE